jgi:hypothetical protein
MPALPFSPPQTESGLNVVDLDELSVSLGLPSAKRENAFDDSPFGTHKSRGSQILSSVLYGKLIGRALDKPLTANALARYLKEGSDSSDSTVKASQGPQGVSTRGDTPNQEHGQTVKMVPPPPGFQDQLPRMVNVEEEYNAPDDPATTQQNIVHPALYGFLHQHRPNLGQPTTPSRHHRRASRRPRGHTRTKRTDQGPEPSAADIYPDDANWTPIQPGYQNYFVHSPYVAPSPQAVVQAEDATSWPTPAEVYTHQELQVPPLAHAPQDSDIFQSHTAPTADDLEGANRNVHTFLEQLPEPSINPLIQLGALSLNPDGRSMSPDQMSGRRYGLNHFGIGLGDEWRPPYAAEPEAFRVRPRDHQGWGGWQWAINKGWGDS